MNREIEIKVFPPTVPTTASPFHSIATHIDVLGMPVAWPEYPPELQEVLGDALPYHPTPCCGACATIDDGPMYCKGCYEEVDFAYGNVPMKPFRSIELDFQKGL